MNKKRGVAEGDYALTMASCIAWLSGSGGTERKVLGSTRSPGGEERCLPEAEFG